jgi:uncharacterized protein
MTPDKAGPDLSAQANPAGDATPSGTDEAGYRALEELQADQVAERLALQPHREGGFFKEVYRSPLEVDTPAGPRPLSTVIFYLLTATDPSRLHRLRSDELWLFHAGAPAELVLLDPAPQARSATPIQVIGVDNPQALVPGGNWLGARVLTEELTDWGAGRAPERRWTSDRRSRLGLHWTLVSCVVTPGFVYEDFELGERKRLLRDFPKARKIILALS